MKNKDPKKALEKMHYEIVGNHSAVQICTWTKKSLLDEGYCYKQKFYGIQSHRCCQMTPALTFCDQKCVFCWRPHELNQGIEMKGKIDDPKDIIEGCIQAQRKKLSGFKGNPKINMKKFKEAQNPNQWAISLSGEPTLYPRLGELIDILNKKGDTTFLVTNGLHPEVLEKLAKEDKLPYQLYVSLEAPNKELHKKINIPLLEDSWERLNKTLELLPKLNCRKVIRLTLIKELNDCCINEFAELIKKANPDFLEIKAYMYVGYSRKRLKLENMPYHKEVKEFSKKLAKELNWKIVDEKEESRVVLLRSK
ncbi:MAG: 4-demethylwyosine synthase TYW1 [Clostridiales bacterium]|nr:4-demethylwyosine synthase TYW1 [Clostridiales bacterium]